ncbi:MAG: hypothetical protein IJ237_11355 [Oscillospiraceae bacterium]|nr:hypothetical protein [Oscillospiraceae bacterium]
MGKPRSDAAWYCRDDKNQRAFDTIFRRACIAYGVNWGTAAKEEKEEIESISKTCYALEKTLNYFAVNRSYYEILKEKEETFCLLYSSGWWSTCTIERGKHVEEVKYSNVVSACESILLQ